jgi:hypothetical protein
MSERKPAPPEAPFETPGNATESMYSDGIPVSIDSDRVYDRSLFRFLEENDLIQSVRFGERAALFRRWIEVPAVTLVSGAWLLVGRDPDNPKSSTPYEPEEFDDARFRVLFERLECEIATKRLRPYGYFVSGVPRRFRLEDLANAAKRLGTALGTATQILALVAEIRRGDAGEPPEQTRRTLSRAATHLALINTLRGNAPEVVRPIAPHPRKPKRRRAALTPINVQLAVSEDAYNRKLIALHWHLNPQEPQYDISDTMIADDRMVLNIKFYKGRPKGSKTRPIHER